MGISEADVQRIYAEELARGKSPREARVGTRTTVQARLHAAKPTPYSDKPTLVAAAEAAGRPLSVAEREGILAYQQTQVTDGDMLASERARRGPDRTHR